jgi:hypothetical protein
MATTGEDVDVPIENIAAGGNSGGPLRVNVAGNVEGGWLIAGVLSGGSGPTSTSGDMSRWTDALRHTAARRFQRFTVATWQTAFGSAGGAF